MQSVLYNGCKMVVGSIADRHSDGHRMKD